MTASASSHPGRHLLSGTIVTLAAEALFPLTSLVIVAILTRHLGVEGYGMWTLAVTIVSWIEVTISSLFSRTVIKLVGESQDWRPIGTTVLRLYLIVSSGGTVVVWLLAPSIASLLREPAFTFYLRLFICGLPLVGAARAHESLLAGIGQFHRRALIRAIRWIARLILIFVFVVICNLTVVGAILGNMSVSLLELLMLRLYIRPSLFSSTTFPAQRLWGMLAPLFLSTFLLNLYLPLDQLLLKMLGGTATQAGLYGAARSLAGVPGLVNVAFAPLLVSTVSRMLSENQESVAKRISGTALRVVIGFLPFAALTAAIAPDLVIAIFGSHFADTAPLLAVLIFGTLAMLMISVENAILLAIGKPAWTLVLTGPLVPLVVIGSLIVIPRYGAIGAAMVSTGVACFGATVAMLTVFRLWNVSPPQGTIWRSVLLSGGVYLLAIVWPVSGLWGWLKVPILSLSVPLAYLLLGECNTEERAMLCSLVKRS